MVCRTRTGKDKDRNKSKVRIPLDVRACRDCRHSVPNEAAGESADAAARCTHPDAALLGNPQYHLAISEAPLCEAVRQASRVCGAEARLFEPREE